MSLSLPFGHSWPQTSTLTRRLNLLFLDNGGEVYRASSANMYCVLIPSTVLICGGTDWRVFFRISHTGNFKKVLLTSFHFGYRPRLGRKERGGAQKGESSEPQCV